MVFAFVLSGNTKKNNNNISGNVLINYIRLEYNNDHFNPKKLQSFKLFYNKVSV